MYLTGNGILRHLDLWDIRNHDPSQKISAYILELACEETGARIPVFDDMKNFRIFPFRFFRP